MSDCIFCKLLSGELEVSVVHQGNSCWAFMDIQPVNPGHILIVTRRHVPSLAGLQETESAEMFTLAQRISTALRSSGVSCEGVNLLLADGEAAGQEVFHVHLHVFPRYRGDGFKLTLPESYTQKPSRSELDAIAQQVRNALEQV